MWNHKLATILLVSTIGSVWCTLAFAQDTGSGQGADQGSGQGSDPAAAATTTSTTQGQTTTVVVQPPATTTQSTTTMTPWGSIGNQDLDKGLSSSSREAGQSGFDLQGAGHTATVTGGANSSFTVSGQSVSVPVYHYVRRGDTLWGLCDRYHGNPWAWPRVWAYNPQVENPHWIYPGDRLRLREGDDAKAAQTLSSSGIVSRRAVITPGTVFLRNLGYIEDGKRDVWGEVAGSPGENMLLTEQNEVYLNINKDHDDIKLGQELAVFSPERTAEAGEARGQVVEIRGTVKITAWDSKTRIARATVSESIDIIERGNLLGPVGRRFDVVPPVQNRKELWGKISGGINPRELLGQHQIVFVDKGSEEGLRPGNRLFVIRRGDPWRESIRSGGDLAGQRIRYEVKKAEVERMGDPGSGKKFPEEVVGEIRVLRTRQHSSTCLVTQSIAELEPAATVVARRGY